MPNECGAPRVTRGDRSSFGIWHSAFVIAVVLAGPGCFPKPNKANIELRKEVQSLQAQIAKLEAQRMADAAQVKALESNRAVETLPGERLERLFTMSGLRFKRLVVGDDTDAAKPGDEGFKVGLVPIDTFGDEFKAAGSMTLELFDLASPEPRIGSWSIETTDAQKLWVSTPVFDGYIVKFPWQTPPKNAKLLVKATFVEELTGRTFEAKADLNVTPPATPAATAQ